jgi:hypothetical protein
MTAEYRLVIERPAMAAVKRHRYYLKRDYDHARKGLVDHARDSERYAAVGLTPWQAWIEQREVTVWERVDYLPVEGVPV